MKVGVVFLLSRGSKLIEDPLSRNLIDACGRWSNKVHVAFMPKRVPTIAVFVNRDDVVCLLSNLVFVWVFYQCRSRK